MNKSVQLLHDMDNEASDDNGNLFALFVLYNIRVRHKLYLRSMILFENQPTV